MWKTKKSIGGIIGSICLLIVTIVIIALLPYKIEVDGVKLVILGIGGIGSIVWFFDAIGENGR